MELLDRFLKYVQIMTPSDPASETVPTSKCQFDLAEELVKEMKEIGVADAHVDDKCYVYGTIPASDGLENVPAIGMIAHMDTVRDFTDHQIRPLVHKNYDGNDLPLGDSGRILKVSEFPVLKKWVGRTLITSDGTTVLGADDKAGVAEIMTAAETIIRENRPHGKICLGFTPDEEVGSGAEYLDIPKFGAEFAYTLDGDEEGGIEFENFNAAGAKVRVNGVNVHPGSAKDIMINAALVAAEYAAALPKDETPRATDGYQGFYHMNAMKGDVAAAELSYIIRDHDAAKLEQKLENMQKLAEKFNEEYGSEIVKVETKHQYSNMRQQIEPHMHLIENARKAAEEAGIVPYTSPIRGGTDGACLSFRGLPCPNLGTGGGGYHGPYEHITLEGMEKTVDMLLALLRIYSEWK